jgi:hypothetical protein
MRVQKSKSKAVIFIPQRQNANDAIIATTGTGAEVLQHVESIAMMHDSTSSSTDDSFTARTRGTTRGKPKTRCKTYIRYFVGILSF